MPLGHGVHVAPIPALSSLQSSLWCCVASLECMEGEDVAAASTKTLISLMGPKVHRYLHNANSSSHSAPHCHPSYLQLPMAHPP